MREGRGNEGDGKCDEMIRKKFKANKQGQQQQQGGEGESGWRFYPRAVLVFRFLCVVFRDACICIQPAARNVSKRDYVIQKDARSKK